MTDMKELRLAIGLFKGLTNCEEKLLGRGYSKKLSDSALHYRNYF